MLVEMCIVDLNSDWERDNSYSTLRIQEKTLTCACSMHVYTWDE